MISPSWVRARPRPLLRSSVCPVDSSSLRNCRLIADCERPSRSAALAKLPRSCPVTKVRSTSISRLVGTAIVQVLQSDHEELLGFQMERARPMSPRQRHQAKEQAMPFVNIKIAGPTLTPDQVLRLQREATHLMAEVMHKKHELT